VATARKTWMQMRSLPVRKLPTWALDLTLVEILFQSRARRKRFDETKRLLSRETSFQ
jgi:hypothetical protein